MVKTKGWYNSNTGGNIYVNYKDFIVNNKIKCVGVNNEFIVVYPTQFDKDQKFTENDFENYISVNNNDNTIIENLINNDFNEEQIKEIILATKY